MRFVAVCQRKLNVLTRLRPRRAAILHALAAIVEQRPNMSSAGTLLSIDKAKRMLDYNPQHSWRNHV